MPTPETNCLRELITSGSVDCPDQGRRCNRSMATHAPDCLWQRTIKRIYKLERKDEGIT